MSDDFSLLLTCEHGGNSIPSPYQQYVGKSLAKALTTHRGYDIGALDVARQISQSLKCPLIFAQTSRLFVDLNRSAHHPQIISQAFKKNLEREIWNKILQIYYFPYRKKVTLKCLALIEHHKYVIHIAIHSFTPKLHGQTRKTEFGLLYDPGRASEGELCRIWQKQLQNSFPEMTVRRNYPYKGVADGLTKALRQLYKQEQYLGIELEINNKLLRTKPDCQEIAKNVTVTLRRSLGKFLNY